MTVSIHVSLNTVLKATDSIFFAWECCYSYANFFCITHAGLYIEATRFLNTSKLQINTQ